MTEQIAEHVRDFTFGLSDLEVGQHWRVCNRLDNTIDRSEDGRCNNIRVEVLVP